MRRTLCRDLLNIGVAGGDGGMPVDVVGALVGWFVSVVGNAGIRSVLDERALSKAMRLATDRVVEQADPSSQKELRLGLRECFSAPPRLGWDASISVSEGLRAAVAAQVAQLDQMMHRDTGQLFYKAVGVDRVWLVEQVTAAILTALPQVTAASSLSELVHLLNTEGLLTRLDALREQISELRVSAPAAATRTLPRDIASFIGRHGELRQLMVAVTGRAGTGGVVGVHAIDGMAGV
ncbi:MAG: hypothetical protein JO287_04270, partial [Pseudonocardiales bacterium]|nr:hypothetical protein [Pseudonocardiales bacterium]